MVEPLTSNQVARLEAMLAAADDKTSCDPWDAGYYHGLKDALEVVVRPAHETKTVTGNTSAGASWTPEKTSACICGWCRCLK